MGNKLAPRPTSALAVVPSRQELEALSPGDLWTLAERAMKIGDHAWEIADERLRHWIEDEGKTQTEIAKLVGRSTTRISERCKHLGISPASNRGRPRISGTGNSAIPTASTDGPNTGFEEVIDAEVVEETTEPSTPDPGPRVKCPTCGHMVKPDDIGAWK